MARRGKTMIVSTGVSTLDEVLAVVRFVRPLPTRIDTGHETTFRRAVYCRHAIRQGQVIHADDLVVLRPNHGVDARRFDDLVGKRAARDLHALERVEVA